MKSLGSVETKWPTLKKLRGFRGFNIDAFNKPNLAFDQKVHGVSEDLEWGIPMIPQSRALWRQP